MGLFTSWAQDEYFRREIKEQDRVRRERLVEKGGTMEFAPLTARGRKVFKAGIALAVLFGICAVAAILNLLFIPGLCLMLLSAASIAVTAPKLQPKNKPTIHTPAS